MNTKRARKSAVINNSRWAAYATAGAASAFAAAQSAEATIHYVSVNQVFDAAPGATVSDTFGFGALSAAFVMENREHPTGGNGHAEFLILGANSGAFAGSSGATTNYRYPFRLASGVNVNGQAFIPNFTSGPSIFFATLASHAIGGHFLQPGVGFIAIRFDAGAGMQYGWIRLNMNGAPGNAFTLVDYAWGDVGDQIATGQVPEPASLGLLALGGVGLLLWRKHRAKAAV